MCVHGPAPQLTLTGRAAHGPAPQLTLTHCITQPRHNCLCCPQWPGSFQILKQDTLSQAWTKANPMETILQLRSPFPTNSKLYQKLATTKQKIANNCIHFITLLKIRQSKQRFNEFP